MKLRSITTVLLAATTLTIGMLAPARARAAPSNEELAKRLDVLEAKIDALIKATKTQKPSSQNQNQKAGVEDQGEAQGIDGIAEKPMTPGLHLDLYQLDTVEASVRSSRERVERDQELRELAKLEGLSPSASERVTVGPLFELSVGFHAELSRFFHREMSHL